MRPGGVLEAAERTLWQSYARVYDGLLDVFTYQDMISRIAGLAQCEGAAVIDAGAGTGNVARALLGAGAARVTAIDSSANMLQLARQKFPEDLASERLRLAHGDVVDVMAALPAGSADRITAVNLLYTLPDRPAFFRQARRVLAPGGFMVVAHTTRPGSGPIIRDQVRRGGLRSIVRPRLISIAGIDLIIDLLARGGRYDFAPVAVLADEAAIAGLATAVPLGRCYGGAEDGVNELVRFSR